MANIRDVARKAGVSIATVSATLNNSAAVSKDARARVWAAVDAVGYAPNAIARSLRLGRSRLIGVVIADISNPYCSTIVRTIEQEAIVAGYSIIVCNTDEDEGREQRILEQLREERVAGIVLTPVGHGPEYRRRVEAPTLPALVTVDQRVPGLERDYVGVDNRAAARLLTQYLLRLGHRRIAMVGGPRGMWTADERMAAFVEAMAEAGTPADPSLCIPGRYRGDVAYELTTQLMTRHDRPTAIVGANNVVALGALQAVLDLGFRCPADVSIVGIDDVPWGGLVRPRVTTAAQPIEDIARVAIGWLLERIAAGARAQPASRQRVFQPTFLAGDSCAAIAAEPAAVERQAAVEPQAIAN
jgi:LacI family transcriptional regulator